MVKVKILVNVGERADASHHSHLGRQIAILDLGVEVGSHGLERRGGVQCVDGSLHLERHHDLIGHLRSNQYQGEEVSHEK